MVQAAMWLLVAACSFVAEAPASSADRPVAVSVERPAPGPGDLVVLPATPLRGSLLLDAGHGAPGNPGNTNAYGEAEQDVMRRVTDAVAALLTADGVGVTRTRPDAALVDYDQRLALARSHDWMISLHSDARAGVRQGWVDQAAGTWWNEGAAGFAVLWSDEGEAGLVDRRRRLAIAVARRLVQAGFAPYPGSDYAGLYDADPVVPGVFVDRHLPEKRIRLLRRPVVPSVIVETHEAHDLAEAARWAEPDTARALARALAAALGDVEGAPP